MHTRLHCFDRPGRLLPWLIDTDTPCVSKGLLETVGPRAHACVCARVEAHLGHRNTGYWDQYLTTTDTHRDCHHLLLAQLATLLL